MAAKITHLEIYRQALVLLEHGNEADQKTASLLEENRLFRYGCFGAVAPDIFYFYHIFSSRQQIGMEWANRIHHSRVFELVLAFLDRVRHDENQERRKKRLAFALGYISHCAADIVTHPYIFYITGNYYSKDRGEASRAQENHLRVENILDSYLVQERWGISPHRYNFLKYVNVSERHRGRLSLDFDLWQMWVNALSVVYPEEFRGGYPGDIHRVQRDDLIMEAFAGFIRFNRLLDTRWAAVRGVLRAVDALTFHRLKARNFLLPPRDMIDDRYPNTSGSLWKYPAAPERISRESYSQLVHRAAGQAADWIRMAREYVDGKKNRKDFQPLIGYNLDTGLVSDSHEMFAFDPIPEV